MIEQEPVLAKKGRSSLLDIPFIAVCAYSVFEYSRVTAMFPFLGSIHAGKIVTVIAILACLSKEGDIRYWIVGKAVVVWLGACALSIPIAINPIIAWKSFWSVLKTCTIFYIVSKGIDNTPKMKVFLLLFWLQHLKLSIWQLKVYRKLISGSFAAYHIQEGVGAGSTGFMGNAGDFGVGLCVLVPLVVFLFFVLRRRIIKTGVLVSIPVFLLSLIATGSRASALGMVGEAISPAIFHKSFKTLVTTLVITVSLIAFAWSLAPSAYKMRFKSAIDYRSDSTAMQRIILFRSGLRMFMDRPFCGVGIGNFRYAFEEKYKPESYGPTEGRYAHAVVSHNNFVNALAETGIFGFLAYCQLIVCTFMCNARAKKRTEALQTTEAHFSRRLCVALSASLISFVITGMLITTIYYPHLFFLAGLSVANYNLTRKLPARSA